ncbi:hypothetical protein ACM64Y_00045 [Novispirillum sp. DQ9]|uniref:hypothetical protein n=1 Tax=Novispirillum sp. DQ9 TaxID=3398612 RepID=UPI003C7BB1D9
MSVVAGGEREAVAEGVLLLDVEAERGSGRLQEIGLVLGGKSLRWVRGQSGSLAEALEGFAAGAAAVAGHNIIAHDLPLLRAAGAATALDRLPVIDTLVLSPLSHPQNPYHRLIKDYKLVREALNDPVADARLARRALAVSAEAFAAMEPGHAGFHAWCLRHAGFEGDVSGAGMADLLERLGARPLASAAEAAALFEALTEGRACRRVAPGVARTAVDDPARRLGLAYLTAWIGVTDHGDSVIPPWVLRSVRHVRALLAGLRDTPCADPACTYCREHHDHPAAEEDLRLSRLSSRASGPGWRQPATAGRGLRRGRARRSGRSPTRCSSDRGCGRWRRSFPRRWWRPDRHRPRGFGPAGR